MLCFFLPVIPNQKSGVPFIEKNNTGTEKKNVFSWLQKKTLFSPIQPTHRGWHNRTNTRCPNRGYTTSMHWSLTQFTPASMEITVPDPSQRKEPKLYRCLGETGRVLFEGGRVVSGGWTILVSSVCVFLHLGDWCVDDAMDFQNVFIDYYCQVLQIYCQLDHLSFKLLITYSPEN